MERYLGLDVHSTSCTLTVMGPTGRRLKCVVVETNGQALTEAVRLIPGRLHLAMEEGTQSGWLYEILSPFVADCVVCPVTERRGNKNDELDAWNLANDLRTGHIRQRVFKDKGRYTTLRQLTKTHRAIKVDLARVKNRIKALYRARGVSTSLQSVYGVSDRPEWLAKLDPASCAAAALQYQQLDSLQRVAVQACKDLVAEAKRHPANHLLTTIPGIGVVRAAEILAVVVSPYRFRTNRQFWSYSGLGIVTRSSADWIRAPDGRWMRGNVQLNRGLNKNCNRTLKYVFKGAAKTVITQHRSTPLGEHYDRLLVSGTKPNLASLTIARRLASITLSIWKNQEVYDAARLTAPHTAS